MKKETMKLTVHNVKVDTDRRGLMNHNIKSIRVETTDGKVFEGFDSQSNFWSQNYELEFIVVSLRLKELKNESGKRFPLNDTDYEDINKLYNDRRKKVKK
jgi:hypothetical protein